MARSIAVAGKGGTGKSTITALVVLELVERGLTPVLAVDADPDASLGALLGIDVERSVGELREDILRGFKDFPAGMTKASYVEAGLHEVIEESEGFDLITMGRGEGAGCYCYLNSLIRKFSDDLNPSYKWVVIDNEAGLEHISRRSTQLIDTLLVVVNDNPLSFGSARRVQELTSTLENRIQNKYIIGNMIRDDRSDGFRTKLEEFDMECIATLGIDTDMEEHVYSGSSLRGLTSLKVNNDIAAIVERIGG